jgi:uncharacterized protein YjbI with pentapeptide repeats
MEIPLSRQEHLSVLKQGVAPWNRWRRRFPNVRPDLSGDKVSAVESEILLLADVVANEVMPSRAPYSQGELSGLDLANADLRRCNLRRANLSGSNLLLANLSGADLRNANLSGCILTSANLSAADLRGAGLSGGILRFANLRNARLDGAMLRLANLDGANAQAANFRNSDLALASITEANLARADLSGAFVYGVSAWNVRLSQTRQQNLRITRANEGLITVDDIKVAQFIYTIINNRNVRDVIDVLTTKVVLILGRFTPQRKQVLDGIKKWLHLRGYVPVVFDFDRPSSRDFTETAVTLAHMARFIIADLTEPASIAKELEAIVPRLAVPVQPILQADASLYAMFSDYWKYDWVLEIQRYRNLQHLSNRLLRSLVQIAEDKAKELTARRAPPFLHRRRQ